LLDERQTSLVRFSLSGMRYETELNGNWFPSTVSSGNRVLDIASFKNNRIDRLLTIDPNDRFNMFDPSGGSVPVASGAFNAADRIEDLGDFDLDHRMDALVFNRARNTWQITLCAFDTDSCERTASLNVNVEYRPLTGDFNGDGMMDILWSDGSDRAKTISLVQGNKIVRDYAINGPMNYRAVATGDFNGDGYEDIVWHDPAASDVLVWFMKAGVMGEIASINVRGMDLESRGPAYFSLAGAANYGHASLIWRDRSSGQVFAWDDIRPNNGALSFMQRTIFTSNAFDLVPTR
jgi:FG-GAP-like repeat